MTYTHAELQAMAPGYVLGILQPDERWMIDAHLSTCTECAAEVASLTAAVEALARSVPQRTPPADLRARVMSSIRAATSPAVRSGSVPLSPWRNRRPWLPVAALLLIALGAGIYGSHLHVETRLAALSERAETSARKIADTRRATVDARSAVEVILAADVIRIDLQGHGAAANASARALWSRQHGMVFAATNMPEPPPGLCHQVWVVTAGTAVSAGILPPPDVGLAVFDTPPDVPAPLSLAVTLEPAGGVAVPTGARVLAGKIP